MNRFIDDWHNIALRQELEPTLESSPTKPELSQPKTEPKQSHAWFDKAFDLANQGKHAEAIKAYDKAIELNPQDPDTWNSKGVSLQN